MPRTRWFALLLAIGLFASPIRGAEAPVSNQDFPVVFSPLADSWDWDWDECRKFWSKLLGKTSGVVGVVSLVVVAGVLIVMSAKKKT